MIRQNGATNLEFRRSIRGRLNLDDARLDEAQKVTLAPRLLRRARRQPRLELGRRLRRRLRRGRRLLFFFDCFAVIVFVGMKNVDGLGRTSVVVNLCIR